MPVKVWGWQLLMKYFRNVVNSKLGYYYFPGNIHPFAIFGEVWVFVFSFNAKI